MCSAPSEVDHHLVALIVDGGNILGGEVEGAGLFGSDVDDAEAALLEHALEVTLALAEGQRLGGIVVGDVDGGTLALLIVVVATLVFIELEGAIAAGIDIERDVGGRTLVAILHLRTIGDDAALTDKDGDALVGGIDNESATNGAIGC